jgi:glycerophosphoryl diester phosphodiesterase
MVRAAGSSIWSPYFGDITPALVSQAHKLDLKVVPWTVNSAQEIDSVIAMDVDGLISDYPNIVLERLQLLGIPIVFS